MTRLKSGAARMWLAAGYAAAIVVLTASYGLADGGTVVKDRPTDGTLQDDVPGPAMVTLGLTGPSGEPLPFEGWPQTQKANKDSPAVFKNIPRVVFDKLGDAHMIKDVRQTIQLLDPPGPIPGGEISDLSIEAVYFDTATGQYQLYNIFGVMAQIVGVGVQVPIPDLTADTNGDGVLDTGDILYSLVNLAVYLDSPPTVMLGQTYDVVDGLVAGLPGMVFSTTPFTFDPTTGFSDGTPYDGPALTEGIHLPSAVPEATTWSMLIIGLAGIGVARCRQTLSGRNRGAPA